MMENERDTLGRLIDPSAYTPLAAVAHTEAVREAAGRILVSGWLAARDLQTKMDVLAEEVEWFSNAHANSADKGYDPTLREGFGLTIGLAEIASQPSPTRPNQSASIREWPKAPTGDSGTFASPLASGTVLMNDAKLSACPGTSGH